MTTQSKGISKFKREEELYYFLALTSLIDGTSVYELGLELKFQEKLENFEACSGIQKALKDAEVKSYSELRLIATELNDKYEF